MASATRPVFIPDANGALVREVPIPFNWYPGMALAQTQRCLDSLHEEAAKAGFSQLLEVSTRSRSPLGVRLSAFNLRLHTTAAQAPVTVEAAFQSSKDFRDRGNLEHLLTWEDGRAIKAAVREYSDVPLEGFIFEGQRWELTPTTAFYDFLYLRALCDTLVEQPELGDALGEYVGFTDIAYNPKKSLNCQARSCALFVALGGLNNVKRLVEDPKQLLTLMKSRHYQSPEVNFDQLKLL